MKVKSASKPSFSPKFNISVKCGVKAGPPIIIKKEE